jgi:putative SOS response-associated peptidase YedK
VPHWAKDPTVGAKMINARAETLLERPAFREAVWQRRCLVLADGFYEWQFTGAKVKQPWHIRAPDRGLLTFAGLWERWERAGERIESCTIITVAGNATLHGIHDRMPAIIPPADRDAWLDIEHVKPGDALPLLQPAAPEVLEAVPVSTAVNRVSNDGPDLVAAVDRPVD